MKTPPELEDPTPVPAESEAGQPVATRPLVEPLPVPSLSEKSGQRNEPPRPRQVMIDSGKPQPDTISLLEASRRAKARKAAAGKPIAVITDENLKDYASRGKLTMAHPSSTKKASAAQAADSSTSESGKSTAGDQTEAEVEVSEEEYWTERVRSLRQGWRDSTDKMAELEARAERLRTDFYAADDPRLRDTRIKPAWDRALDLIHQTRRDSERYQEQLAIALEEGRRAGALPGWLRAGIDLEPPPAEPAEADLDPHDPREPTILEDNP